MCKLHLRLEQWLADTTNRDTKTFVFSYVTVAKKNMAKNVNNDAGLDSVMESEEMGTPPDRYSLRTNYSVFNPYVMSTLSKRRQ